eukprot:gnl/TRDRNA2_/TRDRNA2_159370_c0_seq1.p1 gnl/TRDRNA2_/TRDRNA2_159370_c0~~gnl/TRDRNA2_/TRDRNA2_159370_c0_seq1.p1  ORF type:complete len:551 (+),score=107.35 gnl/TRDRNA2_/TRDRNA2_159370_c0_seq1:73-1653(+)
MASPAHSAAAAGASDSEIKLLPPCEVLRVFPADWNLLAVLEKSIEEANTESTSTVDGPTEPDAAPPPLGRFLHSSLEVRTVPGRGRGVFVKEACSAGELVLVDTPLITARSHAALLDEICTRGRADSDFRRVLLSMCADEADEAARIKAGMEGAELPAPLVSRIIRHNYHDVDPPPIDGQLPPASSACGLWPLGSLVNHALDARPNCTRSFVGQYSCYRLLRNLEPDSELLDNYLDLRLPHAKRSALLWQSHAVRAAGPDDVDAPADIVAASDTAREQAEALLKKDRLEDAFKCLTEATNKCHSCGKLDPAFTDTFSDFSEVAGLLSGGGDMQLQGMAMALEHATSREPYSTLSCALSARLLGIALDGSTPADERKGVEDLAREHVRQVYGGQPGTFEVLNPELSERLVMQVLSDNGVRFEVVPDEQAPGAKQKAKQKAAPGREARGRHARIRAATTAAGAGGKRSNAAASAAPCPSPAAANPSVAAGLFAPPGRSKEATSAEEPPAKRQKGPDESKQNGPDEGKP